MQYANFIESVLTLIQLLNDSTIRCDSQKRDFLMLSSHLKTADRQENQGYQIRGIKKRIVLRELVVLG